MSYRPIALDGAAATRFWTKVDKQGADGCWFWTGASVRGYGRFQHQGSPLLAHRVAFTLLRGPIPENLPLDHLCRVRHCVNPAHLEPVTVQENTLRGIGPSAQCARVTHCPQGHVYDEANTWLEKGRKRHCRACNRQRQQARRDARAAAKF